MLGRRDAGWVVLTERVVFKRGRRSSPKGPQNGLASNGLCCGGQADRRGLVPGARLQQNGARPPAALARRRGRRKGVC